MPKQIEYNPDTAAKICERIMDGRALSDVCRDEDVPSRKTVYKWLAANEDFGNNYARAMEVRADAVFDDMMRIADTPMEGEKVKVTSDGKQEVQKADMIEHRRLQVDVRKWALARMAPKKYGDKMDLNHTGLSVHLHPGAESV